MNSFAGTATKHAFALVLATLILQPRWVGGQRIAPVQSTERSTTLTLTVGGVSKQLSARDLSAMPQSQVTVHNAHTNRDETYTGVALYDLLSASGFPFNKETQPMYLRSYLRAQGTDFYFVIYSASEVAPDLNSSNVLVATQVDRHDLGREGLFKLISTGDKRPARWVRNLLSISLVTLN